MPAFTATAPGKIILFGEHAVVYKRPAIAVPVTQVNARATITPNIMGKPGQVHILAPDIGLDENLANLPKDHPFTLLLDALVQELGGGTLPAMTLKITSTLPVAAGMGSGAAVSVAITRAVAGFLGQTLSDAQVSEIAFQSEKAYHGSPSGIDNTVIAYSCPIYYRRDQPVEFLKAGTTLTLVIAHTGISSSTAVVVGAVRRAWRADPQRFEKLFDAVGEISMRARRALETGSAGDLGLLMNANHSLLQEIGVSCPELDALVEAARQAGAEGAKLSGAGRGGNIIALVGEQQAPQVERKLQQAGAVRTITTTLHKQE